MNTLDKIVAGATVGMVGFGLLAVFLGLHQASHGNDIAVQYITFPGTISAFAGTYISAIYYSKTIGRIGKTKDSQNNSEIYSQ